MVASTDSRWDVSVYDRNHQLVLAVEVKSKMNASEEWATELRTNILAHGTFPKAPYFLIVVPYRFYLWKAPEVHSDQSKPSDNIDARPILQPYLERFQPFFWETDNQISSQNLQLIFTSWLDEFMYSGKSPEDKEKYKNLFIDPELYDALSGGKIEFEAFA